MSVARRKGTSFETEIVKFFRDRGWRGVERRALGGKHDRGDIAGIPRTVIEAKNCKTLDLAGWCNELAIEMANDQAMFGAVIAKRRGKPVSQAYAIMPLDIFEQLLREVAI